MPAKTERQRRFFGAELARRRAGKKGKVKMSTAEVKKMAGKRKKGKATRRTSPYDYGRQSKTSDKMSKPRKSTKRKSVRRASSRRSR